MKNPSEIWKELELGKNLGEITIPEELWRKIEELTRQYNSRATKKRRKIFPQAMLVFLLVSAVDKAFFCGIDYLIGMVKEAHDHLRPMWREDWRAFWEKQRKALEEEKVKQDEEV